MTRTEAMAAGLPRYSTGEACQYGHTSERYTSTGQCVRCMAERYAARMSNRVRIIARVPSARAAELRAFVEELNKP